MVQLYKIENVKEIKERLQSAKSIVLLDYKGVNVEEVNELRKRMRDIGVDYFISKNTFAKRAFNELGINELDQWLKGPTAIAVSKKDEIAPTRILPKFRKEIMEGKDFPRYRIGLIGGKILNPEQLVKLADMPSREELIARVLAGFNAPITGFVGTLGGIIRKFVNVIDQIAKKEN